MKEIRDIIRAHSIAVKAGKKTALATVVKVEGSSYRQPGARMLVTELGELTGAISGGCLEGDALRKALLAIDQKQNKLIAYDTSNEDDLEFGVQLGCNGIVYILFEYIDDTEKNNPLALLQQLEDIKKPGAIVTLFSLNRNNTHPGTILCYANGTINSANDVFLELISDADEVVQSKISIIKKIVLDNEYDALIEYIPPPVSIVIAGAGNDVKPVVELAAIVGWEVSVADGRATHATALRFPTAKKVFVAKPQDLISCTTIDENTFFLLMTHNYKFDLELLKMLLYTPCIYIGMLGPKTKLNRMISDLNLEGITITEEQLDRIYGPVGLDLGAETADEIALSIIAEIKAVMSGRKGTSLRYKQEKIHSPINVAMQNLNMITIGE